MSMLDKIKKKISDASKTVTDEFYVGQDKKARVRFLTDLEDAMEVLWHDKFEDSINVPCLKHYKLDCPYCKASDKKIRTRQVFAWTIYNYELDKVQIFKFPANNFTPVPSLVAMYESYGTLLDRDYVISRTGTGFEISYHVVPMDKTKFKKSVKPFSKEQIMKKWRKKYNVDDVEDVDQTQGDEDSGDDDEESGNDSVNFNLDFDEVKKDE
jgi:hypothetical protein